MIHLLLLNWTSYLLFAEDSTLIKGYEGPKGKGKLWGVFLFVCYKTRHSFIIAL